MVRTIPAERLLLETDGPWCDIRPTHAGHQFVVSTWPTRKGKKWEAGCCVKNRTEPCHVRQVLEVVAGARGEDPAALAAQVHENTVRLFRFGSIEGSS